MRSSVELFNKLSELIKDVTSNTDFTRTVSGSELFTIKAVFGQFRIAFQAELGMFNSYFVTQKGGFDTLSLLVWGENFFPVDLTSKVPEALFDVREASKSLAYELPTATGFHVFRAIESVLRRYHSHVTGGSAPPKVRNIGVYLESLRRLDKGNLKVRAALKQITDLHRNPLIHPETVLTLEQAIDVMGIARSAISAMLIELPQISPTTGTQIL